MNIQKSGHKRHFISIELLIGCVLIIILLFARQEIASRYSYSYTQQLPIVYTDSTGVR